MTASVGVSRTSVRLIAALLALSTVLFVVGVAVERNWGSSTSNTDQHTGIGTSSEASEGADAHGEGGENAEASEGQAPREAGELAVAGIDLESPSAVAAVVVLTSLLIAALWRYGYPALFAVLIVAGLATIADIREIVAQLAQARYGVSALATGVAVSRLAAVIVTLLALRKGHHPMRSPMPGT